MGEKKSGYDKSEQKLFNAKIKSVSNKKYSPQAKQQASTKKIAQRSVRHYPSQTVNIIKHSLEIMAPKMGAPDQTKQKDHDYNSAVIAIKTALLQLASTLTTILTDDPEEHKAIEHHDLLANYFQMPGTHHNGIHLVATSNIEALAEDLSLHKNTREYHWLMNNGVNLLEYEILANINRQMSTLEKGQQGTSDFQHERMIELEEMIDNTKI